MDLVDPGTVAVVGQAKLAVPPSRQYHRLAGEDSRIAAGEDSRIAALIRVVRAEYSGPGTATFNPGAWTAATISAQPRAWHCRA
jgi:hypothetical protein